MKKTLNTRFLARLVLILTLLAGAVHFVHGRQSGKQADAFLHQADAAEERGDLVRAEGYLRRLLALRPGDTDARARLALMIEQSARSDEERQQAFSEMEQVLHDSPGREDVRRREIAMILGNPSLRLHAEAKRHIESLLGTHPNEGTLHDQKGQCLFAAGDYEGASTAFAKAVEYKPDLIGAYGRLAALLSHQMEKPQDAVKVIQAMLAKNGQSASAHLTAASYWKAVENKEQFDKEVDHAYRCDPDNAEVILAVADQSSTRADALAKSNDAAGSRDVIEKACEPLRRGIERGLTQLTLATTPADREKVERSRQMLADMFLALSSFELRANRLSEATNTARRAVASLPEYAKLRRSLVDLLILQKQWEEAGKRLDELAAAGYPAGTIEFDRGRILAEQQDWRAAIKVLENAADELASSPPLAQRANFLLGTCYDRVGMLDRRYEAYRRALPPAPPRATDSAEAKEYWVQASMRLGAVLAEMGRLPEAIQAYEGTSRFSDKARPALAQLLIRETMGHPEAGRKWGPVEELLGRMPQGLEPDLLRADYLYARGKVAKAREQLTRAITKYPEAAEPFTALALLESRQHDPKKAGEILARAEGKFGDRVAFRLARANLIPTARPAEAAKELDRLATGLDKFTPDDRVRLLRGLAEVARTTVGGDLPDRFWDRLASEVPDYFGTHLVRFDRAMQANDPTRLEQAKAEITRLDGAGGRATRIAHVLYQIWKARQKGDMSGLAEAEELLAGLEKEEAGSSQVFLARALIYELQQKPDLAKDQYRQAIDLGERDPATLRRLVVLYFERNQSRDAMKILSKLPAGEERAEGFQQVAAEVYLQARNFTEALRLADMAVPAGTKDYRKQLWLSRVRWSAGEPEKAEEPLLVARKLAPDKPDVWVAIVRYQMNRKRRSEAEKAIEEAKQHLNKADAPIVLAQCYEIAGRPDLARHLYEQALKERPTNLWALKNVAGVRLREGNLNEARKLLERILASDGKSEEDVRFARRLMIIALAVDRNYETSRQALDVANLLDPRGQVKQSTGNETAEEIRTRALALALQRDSASKREAINALVDLDGREPLGDDDQFLLAQLHAMIGDWPKARGVLKLLLRDSGPDNPDRPTYVAFYALGLIRHSDDLDEAEKWVGELEKLQPDQLRTVEVRARFLAASGEVSKARDFLLARADRPDTPLAPFAHLLEELGAGDAAESLYRRIMAASSRPEDLLQLASYYGRRGRVNEALELCEQARKTASPEAVCGTYVAILYSSPEPRAEQIGQGIKRLEEALGRKPQSAELLSMMAALLNLKRDYPAAIARYRDSLAQSRKDMLVSNNLAFLLSASEGKHQDALAELAQAKATFGPVPTLLDTEALVYLAMGNAVKANELLNEAVIRDPTGAHYFHLAQAYLAAKDPDNARAAWRQTKKLNLKLSDLHPLERDSYLKLAADMARN